MRLRVTAPLGLLLAVGFAATALAAEPAKPGASTATQAPAFDRGGFLPDDFVIARVGPRATTVADYVRMYFDSYIEDRPDPDSAGRVTFLDNIVTKDVMGLVALEINRPFVFEDRIQMREHEQRVLSNALFQSSILDSLQVTDADLEREYQTFKWEVRIRRIVFPDRASAERVRRQLQRGQITWKQAYDRYSLSKATDTKPDGELGWTVRGGGALDASRKIFLVPAGGYSEPIEEPEGWTVVHILERKPGSPPALSSLKEFLRGQLTEERMQAKGRAIRDLVRRQIQMVYDTANVAWAAGHFQPTQSMGRDDRGVAEIQFNTVLPDFGPQDTSRVLARSRDGDFTLGRFMHLYSGIQALMRPSVHTPEAFRDQIDGFAFEPYMEKIARERGLDRDPKVLAQLAEKREQLLVEHLYSDSVLSRVNIDPRARRRYYEQNPRLFTTYAEVRFAALWAESKEQADQFAARLRKGEKAEDILRADSLLGINRGSIQTRSENGHGEYQKLIFEELRPGQVTVVGPDKVGHYSVIQSLAYDSGRLLSYDEAAHYIDETLQNTESERLLKAFVARHRTRYPVKTHPELVMRIRLVDPTL